MEVIDFVRTFNLLASGAEHTEKVCSTFGEARA